MNKPLSLEQLRAARKPGRAPIRIHRERPSRLERAAAWITDHVGSMGFFLVILAWTVVWLGWNMFAPKPLRFDPFPAFALWLFISNMIQILLMPLIMVGQNLQSRQSDARAEADFEVNTQAEQEIETILMHLESQSDAMTEILKTLQARAPGLPA